MLKLATVLLLSVEIQRNFRYVVVSEIERIVFSAAVKGTVVDETDHDARGQLTGTFIIIII